MTTFQAGGIIFAADINDAFPTVVTKPSNTARSSTTTITDDPDLSGIALSVGTWEIELLLFWFTGTTTATQAVKTRWAFTGAWNGTTGFRHCLGAGASNTAATTSADTLATRGVTLDSQDAVYQANVSTAFTASRELSRNVIVTTPGSLSLQWAQNASSANATTVAAASTFTYRQIA